MLGDQNKNTLNETNLTDHSNSPDYQTAQGFANSWNSLPTGSVYSNEQFNDWLAPIKKEDVYNKNIIELGCGSGSLITHLLAWQPLFVTGIDLGDSVKAATQNLKNTSYQNWKIEKEDLVNWRGSPADLVYCIGVLHHLSDPYKGFLSVLDNTKPGGKFHCWVYAHEGNFIARNFVEPLRKIASKLPWWLNKYCLALPLSVPFFIYAKLVSKLKLKFMPMYLYMQWISKRNFRFFWHVAFDQLVAKSTVYLKKTLIAEWLNSLPEIDSKSIYIIFRNGNSWKFGGIRKK